MLLKDKKEEDILPYPEAVCLKSAPSGKGGLTDSRLSAHLLRLWAGHLPLATDGQGSNLPVLVGNSSGSTSKTWGSWWLSAIEVTPCVSAVWSGRGAGGRPRLLPPCGSRTHRLLPHLGLGMMHTHWCPQLPGGMWSCRAVSQTQEGWGPREVALL